MANMIPKFGAAETSSRSEPVIYDLLNAGLCGEFTVIHSLPWLSAAARELGGLFVPPTGEVDFLILHPRLGVLALEVKGGRYKIEGAAFVLLRTGKRVDAVGQTRDNVHGLARWLAGKTEIRCKIGYAICFPDSQFPPDQLPPSLVDPRGTRLHAITLTFADMPRLAARIEEVMRYWKDALSTPSLGPTKINEIVRALCPNFDGTPVWAQRVLFDNHFWLRLTDEQSSVVNRVMAAERSIITGWPGTGKTLIGLEVARRWKRRGSRILVVTFNLMLAEYLTEQLSDSSCDVFTWHKLCGKARSRLGLASADSDRNWFQDECAANLQAAIEAGRLANYDALILDEAQALRPIWCSLLVTWFVGKSIVALCDETQVFSFEKEPTSLLELSRILGGIRPFHLTIVMRMPRAVTDRLMEVQPSNLQLSSPRKFDESTVREMVVDDLETCLKVLTDDLFAQGVQEHEIVVLSKYTQVAREVIDLVVSHPGIKICTVSRFRGMEGPVIIIVSADEFSDQELFCAYSRATTVCLALFSAHKLFGANEGAFLSGIVHRTENREIIETLRHRTHSRTLLASHARKPLDAIESQSISWSRNWMCWMVQCERYSPMSLWIDFLVLNYPWPVLYWHEDSQSCAHFAQRDPLHESLSLTSVDLSNCAICEQLSPSVHSTKSCMVCDGTLGIDGPVLMKSQVKELIDYDSMLRLLRTGPTDGLRRGTKALPMALATAAFAQCAFDRNPDEFMVPDAKETSGTDLYRWASIIVKSLILLELKGAEISLSEIAQDTYHPDLHRNGIGVPKWHSTIASAINLHCKNGYLVKAIEGRYVAKGKYVVARKSP